MSYYELINQGYCNPSPGVIHHTKTNKKCYFCNRNLCDECGIELLPFGNACSNCSKNIPDEDSISVEI